MREFPRALRPSCTRTEVLAVAALMLLAAALFAPALGYQFVYDDLKQIVRNPHVHTLDGLWTAFSSHVWSFEPGPSVGTLYYRPLFMVVLTLEYAAFGANPTGYHALSLAIHLLAGWLVWRCGRRLQLPPAARIAALGLFLLHPLQIQAVAWISAVSDPLVCVAALGALLSYLRWLDTRRTRDLVVALTSFGVALLVLERALALFAVFLWTSWLHPRLRQRLASSEAEAAASSDAPLAGLRVLTRHGLWLSLPVALSLTMRRLAVGTAIRPTGDWLATLLTLPAVAYRYARNFVWPVDLALAYPVSRTEHASWLGVWFPLAGTLLLLAAMLSLSRARPKRWWLLGAALATFSPALAVGLLPAQMLVQDRYVYLPLAFISLWLADVVFDTPATATAARRVVAASALSTFTVFALFLHGLDMQPYRDELSLYDRAVAVAPENPAMVLNATVLHRKHGSGGAGCGAFEKAARLLADHPTWGDSALVYYDLGNCLRENHRLEAALRAFERAVVISHGMLLEAGIHRIIVLQELGRIDDAMQASAQLSRQHPDSAVGWRVFGLAHASGHHYDEAEMGLRRSLALDAHDPTTRMLLQRVASARTAQR